MYLGLWVIYTREHGFFYLGHWCGAMNLDQGFNVWPIHWPWTRAYQGLSHGVRGAIWDGPGTIIMQVVQADY